MSALSLREAEAGSVTSASWHAEDVTASAASHDERRMLGHMQSCGRHALEATVGGGC